MLNELRGSDTSIFVGCRTSLDDRDFITSYDIHAASYLHRVIGARSELKLHAAKQEEHLRALIADNRHFYLCAGSPRSNALSEIVLLELFTRSTSCPFAFYWGPGQSRRSEFQLELSQLQGLKSHELDLLGRGDGGAFVFEEQTIVVRTKGGNDDECSTGAGVVVTGRSPSRHDRILAAICGVSGPDTFGAAQYAAPEYTRASGLQMSVPESGVLVAPVRVQIQWKCGNDCLSDIRRVRNVEPLSEPRVWNPKRKQ